MGKGRVREKRRERERGSNLILSFVKPPPFGSGPSPSPTSPVLVGVPGPPKIYIHFLSGDSLALALAFPNSSPNVRPLPWRRLHCGVDASAPQWGRRLFSTVDVVPQALAPPGVNAWIQWFICSTKVALIPSFWRRHHKKGGIDTNFCGITLAVVSTPPGIDATASTPVVPKCV